MNIQASPRPVTTTARTPRAGLVAAATSANIFLVFFFSGALTVVLPDMTTDLGFTPGLAPWALLAYMLTATSFIPLFGRLADVFGRRALYLAGSIVFVVTMTTCALITDPALFIGARTVQGIAAAAIISNTTALLTDVSPPGRLANALGMNATVSAVGQVLGPLGGGLIADGLHWRALFVAGAVIAGTATLLAWYAIPRRAEVRHSDEQIDIIGSVLSVAGLCGIVLGMTLFTADSPNMPLALGATVTGIALLVGFAIAQRKSRAPLIDPSLLADRGILIPVLLAGAGMLVSASVPLAVSLHAQTSDGASAATAALLILPAPLATLLTALVIGRLSARIRLERLILVGTVLMLIGMLLVASSYLAVTVEENVLLLTGLALIGAGAGVFLTPNTTLLMRRVPVARRGVGNALRSTAQNAGYLFGSTTVLAFLGVHTAGSSHAGIPPVLGAMICLAVVGVTSVGLALVRPPR